MTVEIKVPTLGESVTEATVAKWFKQPGDAVAQDEAVCELETDKVTIEVNAPAAGALKEIVAAEGSDVGVGAVLGTLDEGAAGAAASPPPPPAAEEPKAEAPKEEAPAASPPPPPPPPPPAAAPAAPAPAQASRPPLSPAVRKLVDDNDLEPSLIKGTGPDGRLTKGDVLDAIKAGTAKRRAAPAAGGAAPSALGFTPSSEMPPRPEDPREEKVRMTKLRKVIAGRLKQAQNTAAMLTTWNEVDMGAAMELRSQYKDQFEKKHGIRLGFMSFFVRAACIALKEWPAINAEIYGEDLIYKNYYNVGVAVGTPQGLVVPVLKDADQMRFAEIEGTISDFGRRARDGKLGMDEMMGGTFTISNGGVFGSLNSMPILNVPQSAILGMHKIQKRPMAVGDKIEIRPMMYLALSYDHRIVDGREAVSFLVRMKDLIEDPQRIMLDV
ncbi:MAG: 2-oxoglutarate dehydrogenase complex dihydrolipoyllysine-residue succinyltransferase [Rhodospirillales bacterium]|nr:2-oxoglutarate dehydrogenase complex dihydrolipoyllysine-residue succinyltransferase [Rhodospirillales bacterium]MBO6788117.1 2-oxoglutarate dehydrogenase complex dihydrolipoyllysine-residue succinyltransferase [Rhodospirillales bacterium]